MSQCGKDVLWMRKIFGGFNLLHQKYESARHASAPVNFNDFYARAYGMLHTSEIILSQANFMIWYTTLI